MKNIRDPHEAVKACTEEMFWQIVRSPYVMRKCKRIAKLKKLAGAETDEAKRKVLEEEADKDKKSLPVFIFQAAFKGTRRVNGEAVLNGLYMVDFDHVDDPRGQMEQWAGHWPSDNANLPCRGMCEVLGLLLVAITPSGRGLRMVGIADAGRGDLAAQQRWLASQLGMQEQLDTHCKDAARASYAFSADNLLYIDQRLFTYRNDEYDARYGESYRGGVPVAAPPVAAEAPSVGMRQEASAKSVERDEQGRPCFRGIPYADIVAEWWRQTGGIPVMGERNDKLHRLCVNLRGICEYDEALIREVIPTLGLPDEEVDALVRSACQKKTYFRTRRMSAVLAELGLGDCAETEEETPEEGYEAERWNERIPKLPRGMKETAGGVPPRLRMAALVAMLPVAYTLATRITFTYLRGETCRLSGMAFIIGPAGSGKSFILDIDRLWSAPIMEADRKGREAEDKYREERELRKNSKKQPEHPHPVILKVPVQITNAKLAERLRDAKTVVDGEEMHLHLYSCESELATLNRASRQGEYMKKNDLLCKSFHNEMWGTESVGGQSSNGLVQVNYNLLVSGTESAFYEFMPTGSVLDGLPTRIMYVPMPFERYQMPSKDDKGYTEKQQKTILEVADELSGLSGHVDASRLVADMWDWCQTWSRTARLERDEEIDDLRKRCMLIGVRAGILYALLDNLKSFKAGKPLRFSSHCLSFARLIADFTLQMQYRRFANEMREQKEKVKAKSNLSNTPALQLRNVYNQLPKVFTLDDYARLRSGRSRHSLSNNLNYWKKLGYIKSAEARGNYEKIIENI